MLSREKQDYITLLADENGYIEPTKVIEAARPMSSPIHGEFEWDDTRAGSLYRLDQARNLIRLVRVEFLYQREAVIAPYYVVDPTRPPKSKRYVELTRAAREREQAMQVLEAELDRIAAAIRRAQEIARVLGKSFVDRLDELLGDCTSLRTAAEKKKDAKKAKGTKRDRPKGRTRQERDEARI